MIRPNSMMRHAVAILLSATALAGCARQATDTLDAKKSAVADLALSNGAIYTVDGARSWAETIAIDDGRIVYVGTDAGARDYIGPNTRVVDLNGRMVVPGFQDAHIHPISSSLDFISCSLYDLEEFYFTSANEVAMRKRETVDRYLEAVREYAQSHPDERWIRGGGWLASAFGPGALARSELLDAVVPDRPVYLESADGHSAWVNSKALEIAGITKDTPDPPDGRIDRDPETGLPIGSLQEGAADLVEAKIPPPSDAKRDEALRYAIRMLNGYGITTIQDAHAEPAELEAYRRADAGGNLSLRVVASLWWEREQGLEQIESLKRQRAEFTQGHVDAGTVKIMQDGVMENYTAVMLEPYLLPDRPGERGIPMVEPEMLKQAVTKLDAEGFQVHFHAIGDGAIRQSLDAVEAARQSNGNSGLRHHISHLEVIDPADIPRFRTLGVVANFQPFWAFAETYITELTIPFIGPERSQWLYPIGSVYRSGAVVAFGSDWSVSTANPFTQIEVAVTRAAPGARQPVPTFLPNERISLPEAIAAFTINAAFVNRLDGSTGSLEVGKAADLAVLDRNLFDIPATEISDTKVLLTLFEGKTVHGEMDALEGGKADP